MKSPIKVVSRLLVIAPLWQMLAAVNPSAHAQTPDVAATSATTSSPADWTEFHRDNMQRWNPYETALGVNNVGKLGLKWQFPIYVYTSSPAVVNGVVYISSEGNGLDALNASTGAKLWSDVLGFYYVDSSPAVVNGVVYVGSLDNNVYALNASTGAKLWSYATGGQVESSPAVANGVVYVGSDDDHLYALNASTGAKLWSFAGGGGTPAVANGVVYVGCSDGLCALNASTGAKLWSNAHGGGTPAVANGVVYSGAGDNVYALNASTGALLWSFATGSYVLDSPAVANGVVYVGSFDHNVYALNASTGALLWSYSTGVVEFSSPAVANGVVYIGSDLGNLYALNASTGAKLWSYATGNYLQSSPAVVNGTLYVGSAAGMFAFGLGGASADLFLRIQPTPTTVHQGDLLTYAFPVWNLGPSNADYEVLNTQVPAGTVIEYIRISGTPGLGTCTRPPYGGTGQIVCNENSAMAPNTTWTVRLTVKVTAPAGTLITENAATLADTPDPNLANNTATVSMIVQ
jgi:outer membrane protein assembly factor BamB